MKNKIYFLIFVAFLYEGSLSAQNVAINSTGAAPHMSAMLDITSSAGGILIPRMTTAQRIAIVSPAVGLMVFDTETQSFWFRGNTTWKEIKSGIINTLADSDNDTKVMVEKSTDEDLIRFDIAGTERMILKNNRLELTDGLSNVYLGPNAGALNTSGSNNSFFGSLAGYSNITGNYNIAIGSGALYNNSDRSNLLAVGDSALFHNGIGTEYYNQATGNTALGSKTLLENTTGYSNTASGFCALKKNTIGYKNVAIGANTLFSNTSGDYNTACGHSALYSNTTGDLNTAIGYDALHFNKTGYRNVAVGYHALLHDTAGYHNTAIGFQSGYNTHGNANILLGYRSGLNLTTGSNNIIIGYDLDAPSSTGDNQVVIGSADLFYGELGINRIGIGTIYPLGQLHIQNDTDANFILEADADNSGEEDNPRLVLAQDGELVSGALGFIGSAMSIYLNSLSNSMYLMNDYNSALHLGTNGTIALTILDDGKLGIGTNAPTQMLDIEGNARFRSVGSSSYNAPLNLTSTGTLTTSTSDIRMKTNIEVLENSLSKAMKLRGVSFNWMDCPSDHKRIGFIAQEVQEVVPELVFTNSSDGYLGVYYAEMSALLLEAIKEQQLMIEELERKVEKLERNSDLSLK